MNAHQRRKKDRAFSRQYGQDFPPAPSMDDLVAMVVNRDRPPDSRDEIVDWDMVGNPITRGMVDAWAKVRAAQAASQDTGGKE